MVVAYSKPTQARAQTTEQKFLDALDFLLTYKSLSQLTIDEIAAHSGLTRSAFLKRFGSKNQALIILYERYCEKVYAASAKIADELADYANDIDACYRISQQAELLQRADFSANRAMHELYMENLTVAQQTKEIFLNCVNLMRKVQKVHLPPHQGTDQGAYAAAQLLFTINYNHVLKSMPGLPRDHETRHRMIAQLVAVALRF